MLQHIALTVNDSKEIKNFYNEELLFNIKHRFSVNEEITRQICNAEGTIDVYVIIHHNPHFEIFISFIKERKKFSHSCLAYDIIIIGAEVAEQSAAAHVNVTLIESEPTCFSKAFSSELCRIDTDALKKTKVNFMTATLVKEIAGENNKVKQEILADGTKIDTEAVIFSIGYKANSQLAEETGLELNRYGDIHVDNYRQKTVKDISAVVDCAQIFSFLTGRSDIIKLVLTATAEARILGHNIFGIRMKKCTSGTLGVFSTEINGLAMAAAGTSDKSTTEACVEIISARFSLPDRNPGSLQGVSKLPVKLYASPGDVSILGGEAWGGKSVGEIINIISMAIQKSITVYELVSYQIDTYPLLTSLPVNNPIIRAAEEIIYNVMQVKNQTNGKNQTF